MKTRLLKKIKQNYSIIKYVDNDLDFVAAGEEIFRLLYKGEKLKYAWVYADDPNDWRLLVLGLVYNFDWRFSTYDSKEWRNQLLKSSLKKLAYERKKNKRNFEQKDLKKGIKIWP